MNLRFGQAFALLLLVALLCSLGMSPATSNRITSSFQSIFAPITAPVQWLAGRAPKQPVKYVDDTPALPEISDERLRLREENRMLKEQVARLTQQLDAVRVRIAEAERLGPDLGKYAVQVRVLGKADGTRAALKLAGSDREFRGGETVVFTSHGARTRRPTARRRRRGQPVDRPAHHRQGLPLRSHVRPHRTRHRPEWRSTLQGARRIENVPPARHGRQRTAPAR
ncbi:MAG: hypothetical protein QM770_00070 [Tepidisphaeraceae bacterium]